MTWIQEWQSAPWRGYNRIWWPHGSMKRVIPRTIPRTRERETRKCCVHPVMTTRSCVDECISFCLSKEGWWTHRSIIHTFSTHRSGNAKDNLGCTFFVEAIHGRRIALTALSSWYREAYRNVESRNLVHRFPSDAKYWVRRRDRQRVVALALIATTTK